MWILLWILFVAFLLVGLIGLSILGFGALIGLLINLVLLSLRILLWILKTFWNLSSFKAGPKPTLELLHGVLDAHATFSGVNCATHVNWDTIYSDGIIVQILHLFGQGLKVVVEIAAMAFDAGTIPEDKDILVIFG
jgi:hypothetical protein